MMNLQQRKKQRALGVPDNSRTVHAVLSTNCSTPHWVRKNLHSSHYVDQSNTLVDLAGKESVTTKAKLKHHESSPNKYSHQVRESPHSSSACSSHAPRRNRQSRWAINSDLTAVSPLSSVHATTLVLAQQAVVHDLWSPPVVRRSLSHPSVRTEHTPIDLTHSS